jgi:hypothetical protein
VADRALAVMAEQIARRNRHMVAVIVTQSGIYRHGSPDRDRAQELKIMRSNSPIGAARVIASRTMMMMAMALG